MRASQYFCAYCFHPAGKIPLVLLGQCLQLATSCSRQLHHRCHKEGRYLELGPIPGSRSPTTCRCTMFAQADTPCLHNHLSFFGDLGDLGIEFIVLVISFMTYSGHSVLEMGSGAPKNSPNHLQIAPLLDQPLGRPPTSQECSQSPGKILRFEGESAGGRKPACECFS